LIAKTLPPPMLAPNLWRRMACWAYEGLLLFGILFAGGYLFSLLTQTRHALENRHPQQAFLFLLLGLYFIWSWRNGQTLAMKTWRIGVRDHLGRSLSPARAGARYLLCWIWFLPPVLAAWLAQLGPAATLGLTCAWVLTWALASRLHPERQFLHDAWAGTRLVDVVPTA
jgi:uncharacterized RDD family membrane protein YckC